MDSRSLTIEEATSRLPLVRVIVKDAMAVKAGLGRQQLKVLKHETAGETETAVLLEEVIESEEIRLDELHEELRQIDAILADPLEGVVEFRSVLDGDPVWLSWKFGEQEVNWWRHWHEQPDDRRPLNPVGQSAGT